MGYACEVRPKDYYRHCDQSRTQRLISEGTKKPISEVKHANKGAQSVVNVSAVFQDQLSSLAT